MSDIVGFPIPTVSADVVIDNRVIETLGSDPSTGQGALLVRGAVINVNTIADLQALPTAVLVDGQAIRITTTGRAGDFVVRIGDFSSEVASDPQSGIWVPFDNDPDGESIIAVRSFEFPLNVKWFGAIGDGIADDYLAIIGAINAMKSGTGFHISGAPVYFPLGEYFCSQTINLKRRVNLIGDYSGQAQGSTSGAIIRFPANTCGIIVNRHNTIGSGIDSPATTSADGSIIEGLRIHGAATLKGGHTYGIWLRARAHLSRLEVNGFANNNIHIYASSGSADPALVGNANNWSAYSIRTVNSAGSGFYVQGADANAGQAELIDATNNATWGIWDNSFLGNTYLGCHVAGNGSAQRGLNNGSSSFASFDGGRYATHPDATEADFVATQPGTDGSVWVNQGAGGATPDIPLWEPGQPEGTYIVGGSYYSSGANSRSVFLGCYAELGSAGSAMSGPAVMLGGLTTQFQIGGAIKASDGDRLSAKSFSFTSADESATFGGGTHILAFKAAADSSNWHFFHADNGDFELRHAFSPSRVALRVTGENTSSTMGTSVNQPYLLNVPTLALGRGASQRRHTVLASAPSTGEYAFGDIVYNSNPTAGGFVGWVFIDDGAGGAWKTFGEISL